MIKIKDERIDNLRNQVLKEAFTVVLIISALSMSIKFYFNLSIFTEIIIFSVSLIYIMFRSFALKTLFFEQKMDFPKMLLIVFFGSLLISIVSVFVISREQNGFISSSLIKFGVILFVLNLCVGSLLTFLLKHIDYKSNEAVDKDNLE